jgi:acyl carrier protein
MVFEKLQTILAEQFAMNMNSITMDTTFLDDLGADSLDIVELTMAIEAEFDIQEFDEGTVTSFLSVGDVCRYISANYDF